jgi:type II secretory pathway component HofQ
MARSDDVKPSDAPVPETAFGDELAPDASRVEARTVTTQQQARGDRFATHSIGASSASDGSTRFHGAPVDLDLKAADIHDVFRLLADVGKVNIVVAGEVSGTVTLRLRHVPWDQAMDVIAHSRGLVYEREGDIILVRAAAPHR